MISKDRIRNLVEAHGTPLFIVDHNILRKNLETFMRHLPRVQVYYAMKANPDPAIVKTFYDAGASFDVASLQEFNTVYNLISGMPSKEKQDFIWNKIIYANPVKRIQTLIELDHYKPLVTFDNFAEIGKIRKYAPDAGLVLRLRVPSTGAMVELSSKFGAEAGDAIDLIEEAAAQGLTVEGLSFHVGSQSSNFENYMQALNLTADVYREARSRGIDTLKIIDIGGGFPAPYSDQSASFEELAGLIGPEIDRLFPPEVDIAAEPGRFLVATAAIAVASVNGKAVRDGKMCYYIDDGVYHTYSGKIFDHLNYTIHALKEGLTSVCSVFGPTCDALDTISLAEELPDLDIGDIVYAENIGAYSHASSTWFNGFPPAKAVHINA